MARRAGFRIDPHDPLSKVSACVGAPACRNATTDVRGDALKIVSTLPSTILAQSDLHVSGCAKGCAHPGAAGITLTGEAGNYRLGFNCKAGEGGGALSIEHVLASLAALTAPALPRS